MLLFGQRLGPGPQPPVRDHLWPMAQMTLAQAGDTMAELITEGPRLLAIERQYGAVVMTVMIVADERVVDQLISDWADLLGCCFLQLVSDDQQHWHAWLT
jgi:hypothetical protein